MKKEETNVFRKSKKTPKIQNTQKLQKIFKKIHKNTKTPMEIFNHKSKYLKIFHNLKKK